MKKVAIFDFDHTLITRDSFLAFVRFAVGDFRTCAAAAEAVTLVALQRAQGQSTETRTFVKRHMISRLLTGKRCDELQDASVKTRLWQTVNLPVMRTLLEHHAADHTIVIASGGLDLYLPEILKTVPHDALICTTVGVQSGIVTGEMTQGNCVRERKAELVGDWLRTNGPFEESFGYGNFPHDVAMLNLVDYRILVS